MTMPPKARVVISHASLRHIGQMIERLARNAGAPGEDLGEEAFYTAEDVINYLGMEYLPEDPAGMANLPEYVAAMFREPDPAIPRLRLVNGGTRPAGNSGP